MHANAALLNKLFTALGAHDCATMMTCYHPRAHFRDIAFDCGGLDEIRGMWRMICEGLSNIEVLQFEVVDADDRAGFVRLVEKYTYASNEHSLRRPVYNVIESRFLFEDGRILSQHDACDAKEWARQAMGGIAGFLAGRLRLPRSIGARKKLKAFARTHPEHG